MTSQSLNYGGIHDSHFEYIQTTVTSLFRGDFENTCIKINSLLSTLHQYMHTAYNAFPFKHFINLCKRQTSKQVLEKELNDGNVRHCQSLFCLGIPVTDYSVCIPDFHCHVSQQSQARLVKYNILVLYSFFIGHLRSVCEKYPKSVCKRLRGLMVSPSLRTPADIGSILDKGIFLV